MEDKMRIIVLLFLSVFPFNLVNATDSLEEISKFSKDICDEINPKGNKKISKADIEGRLEGDMGKIAKFIGVTLEADGKITYGESNEEYEGLPLDSISEQMSDSRSCKKEISMMLIKERKKVSDRSDKKKLALQTKRSNGYEIVLEKYSYDDGVLTMDFIVKSLEKDNKLFVFVSHGGRRTKLVDGGGKMHYVSKAGIGGGQTRNMFASNTLYQDVPMTMNLTFAGLPNNLKKISVLDITFGNGSYKFGRSFSVKFKDLVL